MKFGINTIDEFDLKGKTVLCRVDMNQPVDRENDTLKSTQRIEACAPTVKELAEKGARVVLMAHQGSDIEYQNYYCTRPHARVLSSLIGREVKWIDDVCGPAAREAVKALKDGEILLLDNVRYCAEEQTLFELKLKLTHEEQARTQVVTKLAPLADLYVNDAFAASHRDQPTLCGFEQVLPSAMGRLFDLEDSGYFYTRLQNPTNDMTAAKIAALEGGVAGMLTSSGQAANFFALFNICEAGSHIIASSAIYGGTYNLLGVTMKKMGINVTFIDQDMPEEELDKLFKDNTRAVFGETITNPTVSVFDIEKFARLAHKHGVPLIVDNTFATPVNCRPIEWGADIVTHSTTKYMDGHAVSVGGAIVDSGNFDWMAHADKFPGLTTPDESYHGLVYAEKFGKFAYITKATSQLMRDLGSIQSPQNAFYLNNGLESLHVRMNRHCENALKIAKFLSTHEKVAWIDYPDLEDNKYHELAKKYLPNGSCGVMAFAVKGGRDKAIEFMDALKLATIATHVADARTCLLHPASHTHRQLSDEQLREAGVAPDLIRLSVGLENADDLIEDLTQALAKI